MGDGDPWLGTVDTSGPEVDEVASLSPEQDARVSALYHARGVLSPSGGILSTNDLLRLANYILTGE